MKVFSVTQVIDEELADELRRNLGRDLEVAVQDSAIMLHHPRGQRIVITASPATTMLKGDALLLHASLNVAIGDREYGAEAAEETP